MGLVAARASAAGRSGRAASSRALASSVARVCCYSKALSSQLVVASGSRACQYRSSAQASSIDGWIRVKVRRRRWINTCDWETKQCADQPASGRAGPADQDLWLFADCSGARFASSSTAYRSEAWEQNVFYEEGEWKGTPKFQTVHGNPFMQWGKLCPAEAEDGMRWIQKRFRLLLKPLKGKSQ